MSQKHPTLAETIEEGLSLVNAIRFQVQLFQDHRDVVNEKIVMEVLLKRVAGIESCLARLRGTIGVFCVPHVDNLTSNHFTKTEGS